MNTNPPNGWQLRRLEEVVDILDNRRIPVNAEERAGRSGDVPYYGATGQVGWIDEFIFDEELVILGEDGAPFLDPQKQKAYLISGRSWVNNHAHVLRAVGTSSRFLLHQLNATDYQAFVSGTTRLKLPQGPMRKIPILVPPEAEQERIVATIEQHLSDVDAGISAIERALANLKRYRASVLKAACEGRLVPTEAELARKEERDYEPADVLLRRISKERRARWEADQLAKMKAKGQPPRNDQWKQKYEEAEPPNAGDLVQLPKGWRWASFGMALTAIEAGFSFKCDEREPADEEIGVIKVSAVTWGEYDEHEAKTCTDPSRVEPTLFVSPGDFLFSRANTIDLVGACVIAKRVTRPVMLSDKILRFRLAVVDPYWILYVLRSRFGRDEIERLATGNQESMRNIGQERIRQIRIPLPPLAEQHRIVAEVDRLLSTADETEQTLRAQLARAARLRQAVLKRAFEGKLVPQDPSDEPASVLLARLRAQEPPEPKRAARGRPRRTARASEP